MANTGGCTGAAAAPLGEPEFAASAESILSISAFTLGLGIEGRSPASLESFTSTLAVAEIGAGTSTTDLAKSALCGKALSRTMVASSIGSPQWLRLQLGPHSQRDDYTAQKVRWHWPIGHIYAGTELCAFGLRNSQTPVLAELGDFFPFCGICLHIAGGAGAPETTA